MDKTFPLALAGALITILATRRLESPFAQPFTEFIDLNRWRLAALALGLLSFGFGFIGPRARLGPHAPTALPTRGTISRRGRRSGRRWLASVLILIAALEFVLLWRDTAQSPIGLDGPALLFSAMALVSVGFALLECRRRGWWRDLGLGPRYKGVPFWRRDLPWLLLMLGVWAGCLAIRVDTRPGYFNGDEATVIVYGRMTYDPVPREQLVSPWHNVFHPFLSCIPRYFAHSLFPERPYLGSRIFGLLASTLTLAVIFIAARALLGRLAAWLAIGLLASGHVFVAFARSGLTNIDALLVAALWLLFMGRGWRSRRPSMGLLAGMTAGLGHYVYYSALAILPITIALMLIQIVRDPRSLYRRWRFVLAFALGYGLASMPNHLYNHAHPGASNFRIDSVYLLNQQNIQTAFDLTGTSDVPAMMVRYAWPAFGGVLLWPHAGLDSDFASRGMPIVDRDTAALMLLGFVGALVLWRRRFVYLLLLSWWAGSLVLGSLLTLNAPYVPRVVLALGAGYLLGAGVLASLIRRARLFGSAWLAVPLFLLAVAWGGSIASRNLRHYYADFAFDLNNVGYLRTPMGFMEFVRDFPPDAHMVYYARGPYEQFHFAGIQMFDRGFSRVTYTESAPLPPPRPGRATAYVVRLLDFPDVDRALARRFPEVRPIEIRNPLRPNLPPTCLVYWVYAPLMTATPTPTPTPTPRRIILR